MQKTCPRYKYTQNPSLFPVAPYILNNLLIHQNEKITVFKKTSFNHKKLTTNQFSDTF